jgi:23S rRNA (adenine2503-C2)-methyltransferase
MEKTHLLAVPPRQWADVLEELGSPRYRSKQLQSWIFQQHKICFQDMGNLPQALREQLSNRYTLQTLSEEEKQVSQDGTVKWALKTRDGYSIECVLIPEGDRYSVCLSSQVGCAMGCRFCSTAKMGLLRNLNLGEIVEQFQWVNRYVQEEYQASLTNVIFMGMGEPLQNIPAVGEACDLFTSPEGYNLSRKKITVSTSGLAPQIVKWAKEYPGYKLAFSLNGSNNTNRSDIMPVNRSIPIEKLLESIDYYQDITGNTITFEYVLIKGKTCTLEAAQELRDIAAQRNCKVNLIPLNGGGEDDLEVPSEKEIADFQRELQKNVGNKNHTHKIRSQSFPVVVRRPRGRDISAACGQLVQQQQKVA